MNEIEIFCLSDMRKALGLSAKIVDQRFSDEVVSKYPIKKEYCESTASINDDKFMELCSLLGIETIKD